jgi:demethylmenaquinone methyltransferase / 2-methoxy-6-polyprenyl-1,4-benzoquinol methylase
MFSDIAPKYDLTNSVLSLGVHHLWRRATVKASGARAGMRVLDCATGTGDLALAFKKAVGPTGRVVGTDFNADMLSFAPAKARAKGLDVEFEVADAMQLPYADATFDISSIAFGIRNVDDPVVALSEMARVVVPGGKVVVLEFGQPRGIMGLTYRFYSKHIIPVIGGILTGHREAYEYLPETAAAFPCREDFLERMRRTGRFADAYYKELTGGIAFLYVGTVQAR